MITDLADEKGLETLLTVLDAEFIEEELLRKAGLNRDEQQQILCATNAEYDAKKIETA